MKPGDWIIYYGDLSTYSSESSVWDAPGRNVQVIVQIDERHGWYTQATTDYYVWDCRGTHFRWYGVDQNGLWDYLTEPGQKKVLFGRTVDNFEEIFKLAQNETRLPKKTGYNAGERTASG